jgi:predicted dehydrogenase
MNMNNRLRAVVIGAGFAGEGHTLALRHAGVQVVAICARQPQVVQTVADRLAIPQASTDWRRVLETVKPDIVALATPASLRCEVIELAAALGCHLFCDKPLATTAEEAGRLYRLVERAGVKHAYAATQRYDPSIVWLGELVRDGAIGSLCAIDFAVRLGWPPLAPWGWWDSLAAGGGVLNNWFTHVLGMLTTITGGELQRVVGQARPGRRRAPLVPDIHDFRLVFTGEQTPTPDEAARLPWRACDADGAFSALLATGSVAGEVPVTVVAGPRTVAPWAPNGWRLSGEEGVLLAEGFTSFAVSRLRGADDDPEPLPVPQRLLDELPAVGDDATNKWAALAGDFVADVCGQAHRPYLTFRDGWRYQEAIDAIRAGLFWVALSLDGKTLAASSHDTTIRQAGGGASRRIVRGAGR